MADAAARDLRAAAALYARPSRIDGIAEVFNLANSPIRTTETTESNRQFGQAIQAEFRRRSLGSG